MSQNVNVNLVPGSYPKEFHVSQYDVGRQLVANIVDSTGAYSIPSGATVTLVGTKPSGFGFTLSGSVGSGGVVTFSTTATVTAEYGRIPCELRITSGSTILGTANCMLIVEESPHPEGTTDGDGEVIINQITLLLEQITQQADRADDAKEDAEAAANEAKTSELAAEGYAVGKQNGTDVGPESPYYHNNCKWYGAQFDEALKDYAKINGYYKDMTVGTAKQLLSDSTTTDTEPYIYRQTAGDGDREEVEEVVGGTVSWNQLIRNGNFDGSNYWSTTNAAMTISGGVVSVTVSAQWGRVRQNYAHQTLANHRYLVTAQVYGDPNIYVDAGGFGSKYLTKTNTWEDISFIASRTSDNWDVFAVGDKRSSGWTEFKARNVCVHDLTAMFGTTIADSIYAMEQSQVGAGVAWFKALFPEAYYPYNSGELMSVKTSAHVTKDADENVIGNYPLSPIDLRGIPKWVDGRLKFDGDVYSADGVVTRNTVYRSYQSGDESLANAITDGSHTVVYSATATTETVDPYTAIQVCDPNGTEEWTDERTVQIPVGNVTKYHANLKEKLEDLPTIPTAPSANGTYTLKATVSDGAVTYQWVNG